MLSFPLSQMLYQAAKLVDPNKWDFNLQQCRSASFVMTTNLTEQCTFSGPYIPSISVPLRHSFPDPRFLRLFEMQIIRSGLSREKRRESKEQIY